MSCQYEHQTYKRHVLPLHQLLLHQRLNFDHLDSHLGKLPDEDHKSRTIVKKMSDDEAAHRDMANDAGAHALPSVIKKLMKMSAKVMTKVSYRV